MTTTVPGYTGLNIDGKSSLQTGQIGGFILTAGDQAISDDRLANGVMLVATGHATNALTITATQAARLNENQAATKIIVLVNGDAALAATIKVVGGTGVTVAATKRAMVMLNAAGTDFVRLTADA